MQDLFPAQSHARRRSEEKREPVRVDTPQPSSPGEKGLP